jgi:hypothetical protein
MKQFIDKLRARAVETSMGFIGTALLTSWIWFESYLAEYVSVVKPTTIVRIVAVLSAITAYSWAAYFWYKPKLIVSQKDGACLLDKKTGTRYCASCKAKHNRLVALNDKTTKWSCPATDCYQIYSKKNNDS